MISRILGSSSRLLKTSSSSSSSSLRLLSSAAAPPTPPTPQFAAPTLDHELAKGITDTTRFYVSRGIASQQLASIKSIEADPASADKVASRLVLKWQKMMEAHFTTQVTVLSALGYPQSEQGLQIYNSQLQQLMQNASPESQEALRVGSRDLWRTSLGV